MTLHVVFTKEGIPGWIGSEPRDGSEPIENLSMDFLVAHRRTDRGKWVLRAATIPEDPSPEALAEAREAAYQAALDGRDHALREALAVEADPLFFRWQRDEATKEDWLTAVAEVKTRYPKPERD